MAKNFSKLLQTWLIFFLRFYQLTLSNLMGHCCRFEPSCSNYAIQAINFYGPMRGSWLTLKRLLSCHPWHPGGFDPLPPVNSPTQS